jgi:hypothetical protein
MEGYTATRSRRLPCQDEARGRVFRGGITLPQFDVGIGTALTSNTDSLRATSLSRLLTPVLPKVWGKGAATGEVQHYPAL